MCINHNDIVLMISIWSSYKFVVSLMNRAYLDSSLSSIILSSPGLSLSSPKRSSIQVDKHNLMFAPSTTHYSIVLWILQCFQNTMFDDFICNYIRKGIIHFLNIGPLNQIADIFTKSFPIAWFHPLVFELSLAFIPPISSLRDC